MVVNPNGLVRAYDFGNPKIISGKARETISGGFLVGMSGAAASPNVGSSLDSYALTDIQFIAEGSGANFVGIAINTATSGQTVNVALDGAYIVTAAGNVLPGQVVKANGGHAVVVSTGSSVGNFELGIGRALTAGGSEQYVLVSLR